MRALMLATDVSLAISSDVEVEKALKTVHRRMNSGRFVKEYNWFKMFQRIAAVLFIPLLIVATLQFFNRDMEEGRMVEFKTNPGMTASVELPDGSEVLLNSSSVLRYCSDFGGSERGVELVGEAFFSVVKGQKPFVVNVAGSSRIVVYGTEFNVDAYGENEFVSATLVSGKVGFSYIDNGVRRECTMHPGEKLMYDKNRHHVDLLPADVEVETCWREGRLIFKDTPFKDILKELGRQYNVEFAFVNPELEQYSFTANFGRQRLERILEYFQVASDIHFKFVEAGRDRARQIIEVY